MHAAGRIGFVFQDPTLMPWTTVSGNVLLPFRLAGRVGPAERERAAQEIRAVGLAGFERAYPRQLSGALRLSPDYAAVYAEISLCLARAMREADR